MCPKILAESVEVVAPPSAQIAEARATSGAAPACAVTEQAPLPAPSVGAQAGTPYSASLVAAAREYVRLYDKWWASLMRGPFNQHCTPAHWALSNERHAAWQQYTDQLAVAGLAPADRRGFARQLADGGDR